MGGVWVVKRLAPGVCLRVCACARVCLKYTHEFVCV